MTDAPKDNTQDVQGVVEIIAPLQKWLDEEGVREWAFHYRQGSDETGEFYPKEARLTVTYPSGTRLTKGEELFCDILRGDGDWCAEDFTAIALTLTRLPNLLALLLSEHEGRVRAEAENEQLRLAICGGEDAPGYAASVPLGQIIEIAQTQGRERAELAEAATAIAQARVEELERALATLAEFRKRVQDQMGEAVHTGLRKGVDGKGSHDAWMAIRKMAPGGWGEAIEFALYGMECGLEADLKTADALAQALNPTGAAG